MTDGPNRVADFEALAREAIEAVAGLPQRAGPPPDFETISSFVAGNETLRRTPLAFDALALRTRVLPGVASPDLSVTVLGQDLKIPVMLAPAGAASRENVRVWFGASVSFAVMVRLNTLKKG